MLRAAAAVAPRSVFVCGSSVTAAGLTVAANREAGRGGDVAIEAGALVIVPSLYYHQQLINGNATSYPTSNSYAVIVIPILLSTSLHDETVVVISSLTFWLFCVLLCLFCVWCFLLCSLCRF